MTRTVDDVAAVMETLHTAKGEATVHVAGHELHITHLDKVLWPATELGPAFTKRDLLNYFAEVSRYILPHLKSRPVALSRYPGGIQGEHFFQKHLPATAEGFFDAVSVYSESNGKAVDYPLVKGLESLLWLGQMGVIEIHPWQSLIAEHAEDYETESGLEESALNRPDFMILDLDPYTYSGKEAAGDEPELNPAGWRQVVDVATQLKEELEAVGMKPFAKTSGKTGLHVFVPLAPMRTYESIRAAAKTIAEHLESKLPGIITLERHVKDRPAKVYFDYGQNVMGKTLASVYSPRAVPGGLVSFPVSWERLESIYPTDFSLRTVPELLQEGGDPWTDIARAAFHFD